MPDKPKTSPIVCLSWGSLIAAPGELQVGEWHKDGPLLPVEFARQSSRGRMTLVVMKDGPPCTVHWAEVRATDLSDAVKQLKDREGCQLAAIGRWPNTTGNIYPHEKVIEEWAKAKGFSGVVWTALKPGFSTTRGTPPTLEEILAYLATLEGEDLKAATDYVAGTPIETQTPFRAKLEQALGIKPKADAAI